MIKKIKRFLTLTVVLLSIGSQLTPVFASEVETSTLDGITALAESKRVRVKKEYTKKQYPTRYEVPQNIWYSDGTYSGYIYLEEWWETQYGYVAYYSGNVLKGPYVPQSVDLTE